MDDQNICVFTADGEFAAQQVKAFLAANDIPCELRGEALRKTHALTLDGLGAVRILVPAEYLNQARELLASVEAGDLELPDTE